MTSNKGALSLLAEYGGESSDEEIVGPRVSIKRMYKCDDEDEETKTKRFERLPRPNFSVSDPEAIVDDPSLHEGRIRSFAHERGNWATHVFIPYEHNDGLEKLISVINKAASLRDIELKYFSDFHISLSRTVTLRHHWIELFITSLKGKLSPFGKFIVMLDSLQIYENEEKTRTFLGLHIRTGYDTLLKLMKSVDNSLVEFKLPKFYNNPSFHVSIAWCLGDCRDKLETILPSLNNELHELMNEYCQEYWYICVETVLCKIGNKVCQFHLK